jgi:membrane-bound serine protease (ClpP class)
VAGLLFALGPPYIQPVAEETAAPARRVMVLTVEGPIGPATADFVERAIDDAAERGAALIVLQMDTPGGLDTSMRQIIKAILASRVAVAAFVAPQGARAASAGTFILYASHVAAMAPGTNLGAATPVPVGVPPIGPRPEQPPPRKPTEPEKPGDETAKPSPAAPTDVMTSKQVSDAAAYIRGLAQLRGRNAEWAERAVREAVSLSAEEALKEGVIDVVAADLPELLAKLEGREIKLATATIRLELVGAATEDVAPGWRTRFLQVITNPTVALILMLLGVYGLYFELTSPGFGLPGIAGAICLVLALFAFQLLPVSYAGLGLILLGIALIIAETFVPGFGILGAGGIVAFVIGGVLLLPADAPGFGIPISIVVALALVSAAFILIVARLALKARRRPVVSGREELVGSTGEVIEAAGTDGWATVHGERWHVRSAQPLHVGQVVRVTGVRNLMLEVIPELAAEKGS